VRTRGRWLLGDSAARRITGFVASSNQFRSVAVNPTERQDPFVLPLRLCCLMVPEMNAGGRSAAQRYSVATTVLGTLGRLAGSKGGKEARKGPGAQSDFTAAERIWLEEAIKLLVRRAAEVAHDPTVSRPQITMAELPSLES
jgi:hypothetical protein